MVQDDRAQKQLAELHEDSKILGYRLEQARLSGLMKALADRSMNVFKEIPDILTQADHQLDQAEKYYKDNAYVPFWNCIEKATNLLGTYHQSIRDIDSHFSSFTEIAKRYEGIAQGFPISTHGAKKLVIGETISERLHTLASQAQRNFEFTLIFEQRKTHKIPMSGIKTLFIALDEMTQSITSAVDDLNTSMANVSSEMSVILEKNANAAWTAEGYQVDQAIREEQVIKLLNDIQQRRH
jgi:hypothetical protein